MQKIVVSAVAALALFVAPLAFAAAAPASVATITLVGGSVSVTQNTPFVDPGFSAFSTTDGDITSSVLISPVDTGVPGDTSRDYSVTDSTGATADETRDITVVSAPTGGALLYCSGPEAPGYTVGVMGGGCGGSTMFVPFNGDTCTFMQGCMMPKKQN